jgi:dipeptidyl aminopeptidase/acylaminoacyl peptidase
VNKELRKSSTARVPRPLVYTFPHTTRRYSGPSPLAFSPDGTTLAFASPKDGPAVLCEIPVGGGMARATMAMEGLAVHGIVWSSSGDLYVSADRGGTESWQIYVRRPDGNVEDFAVSDGHRVQHHLSRSAVSPDGRSVAISTNGREEADVDLAVVDAQTRAQRLVLANPAWHVAGGWSPDGRWLCAMRVAQNTDQDLLAIDVASGEVTELSSHQGEMQNVPAGWLADGRLLAITDHGSEFLHLEAIDVHSGRREAFDQPEWDVELAATSADGRGVAWSVNEDGYSRLRWRLGSGPTGERETGGMVGDLVLAADGAHAAYTLLPVAGPQEIHVIDLVTGEDRVLFEGEPAPEYAMRPESIRIPGTEGPIPAYVWRAAGIAGRRPALLVIHGGPEGQSRPVLSFPVLLHLLDRGVTIVVPNVHGSTGYGKSWQTRIHRDWGGIDLADFRSIVEWMRKQPDLDPDRLGVWGGSYGGFATLTCVTRLPEHWRCAVELFGPSNLVTMLENDPPNWRRWNRLWIGDLATDREKLIESSPITHVENVRCPLLIFQGANDPRVPREESDQMVERLRSLGRPVEYVTFEGEGHGFAGRDAAQLVHERTVDFFERNLLA